MYRKLNVYCKSFKNIFSKKTVCCVHSSTSECHVLCTNDIVSVEEVDQDIYLFTNQELLC